MYHRYTSRSEGLQTTGAPRLQERIRNILLLVLVVACILLAIFGGRAMGFQAETESTFIRRMQTECNDALSLTGALSRTAGANSAATIGRIRSHLYAMDTINQLNVGLQGAGGYLISTDVFTSLYSLLDDYSDKLITGMQTGDLQTELTTSLTALADLVNQLD
ncbi:MAG: hypothetical protein E7316_05470 [Clostridiales bacterium]|nr:hypothetical protein [Clostridiales bacterium]